MKSLKPLCTFALLAAGLAQGGTTAPTVQIALDNSPMDNWINLIEKGTSVATDVFITIPGDAAHNDVITVENSTGTVVATYTVDTTAGVNTPGTLKTLASQALPADGSALTYTAKITTPPSATPSATGSATSTMDLTAPSAPALTAPTATVSVKRPPLSGTAEAGTQLTIQLGATTLCTIASVPVSGNWSCVPTADLNGGGNSLTLTSTDAAKNTSDATATVTLDNIAPTLTITDSTSATKTNTPVTFSFTFSESVSGFAASAISVTGGSKGAFSGSGSTYTLVVAPTTNSTADINVSVAAGAATDAAGNGSTAASASQGVDTQLPTLTISDNVGASKTKNPVTFTFNFGESVTGFTASDISVTGGSKGAFSGSGSTYTLVVTPTANSTTDIDVSVATGAATDAAGNGSTAADASQGVDTQPPTLTINDNVGASKTKDPVTFTFNFDEPVTGFTASDISVTGGSKGTFSGSGNAYTLVVTPAANSTTDITISVASNVANDAIGNGNSAANTSQGVDTKTPGKASISLQTDGGVVIDPPADTDLDNMVITFTDEANVAQIITLTKSGGNWSSNTLPSLTTNANGKVTIQKNGIKDSSSLSVRVSDKVGNTSINSKTTGIDQYTVSIRVTQGSQPRWDQLLMELKLVTDSTTTTLYVPAQNGGTFTAEFPFSNAVAHGQKYQVYIPTTDSAQPFGQICAITEANQGEIYENAAATQDATLNVTCEKRQITIPGWIFKDSFE